MNKTTKEENKIFSEEQALKEISELSNEELDELLYSAIEVTEEMEEEEETDDIVDDALLLTEKTVLPKKRSGKGGESELLTEYISIEEDADGLPICGRKTIDYGGETEENRRAVFLRSLESALHNKKRLNGKVIACQWINAPNRNQIDDVMFTVRVTSGPCKKADVRIKGSEMSEILIWNRKKFSKKYILKQRGIWAKALPGAEIQFCLTHVEIVNPNAVDPEYILTGSRIEANKQLRKEYFDINSPNRIRKGDIVNGKVLVVLNNKVAFNVAGWDLYLSARTPYITGTSQIEDHITAKALIDVNEEKRCRIQKIYRNKSTLELSKLRISFFEAMKDEVEDIIGGLQKNARLLGRVLRYQTPKADQIAKYIIVKADIGIEILCFMPNWKRPPMIGDIVKIKVVNVEPGDKKFLVVGSINR